MLRVTMRVTWWRSVQLRHLQHRIMRKLSVVRIFACCLAAALVAILALGVGMVGSGKKVYLPMVSRRENRDESTTKVNNSDNAVTSSYDEEEVCQGNRGSVGRATG